MKYPSLTSVAEGLKSEGRIGPDIWMAILAYRRAYDGQNPTSTELARMLNIIQRRDRLSGWVYESIVMTHLRNLEAMGQIVRLGRKNLGLSRGRYVLADKGNEDETT